MGERDVYVRTKESTQKLVRIFAGEVQMETGRTVSDNNAIMELFRRYRPDLIDKLKEVMERPDEPNETEG